MEYYYGNGHGISKDVKKLFKVTKKNETNYINPIIV
jgi:hypothetical protein